MRQERDVEQSEEQPHIVRTPLQVERVRAILSFITESSARVDFRAASGGATVLDWLLGDDEVLERDFGISSGQWEQ